MGVATRRLPSEVRTRPRTVPQRNVNRHSLPNSVESDGDRLGAIPVVPPGEDCRRARHTGRQMSRCQIERSARMTRARLPRGRRAGRRIFLSGLVRHSKMLMHPVVDVALATAVDEVRVCGAGKCEISSLSDDRSFRRPVPRVDIDGCRTSLRLRRPVRGSEASHPRR